LTKNLDITFSMIWTLVIANILAAGLLMAWSNQVAKVAFVRGHLIVPGAILFVLMGAWLGGASMGDWVACISMGAIGFVMKRGGWPRPPLILALILGQILENAFQISMGVHDGFGWLGRPIVLVILTLITISLAISVRSTFKARRGSHKPVAGEGSERNPVISVLFTLVLTAFFASATVEALGWPDTMGHLPLTVTLPAIVLVVIILVRDLVDLRAVAAEAGSLAAAAKRAAETAIVGKAGAFFGYLVLTAAAAHVVGQMIALPVFVGVYLWRWGGYGWRISLGYTAGGWLILYGFYDQVMHVMWHQPLLPG